MNKQELAKQITLVQDVKKTTFTKDEINFLQEELSNVPDEIIKGAFSYFLHSDDFYTTAKLMTKINEIAEDLDPNNNPVAQWALVYREWQRDELGTRKVIFDNIRTNLTIEAMGGQSMLVDRLDRGMGNILEKLKEEFTYNFRKISIPPFFTYRRLQIEYDGIYKNEFKIVGCDGIYWIKNDHADQIDAFLNERAKKFCLSFRGDLQKNTVLLYP